MSEVTSARDDRAGPGDPLSGPAFALVYDQKIAPQLRLLERDRRGAVWLAVLFGLVLAAAVGGESWLSAKFSHGRDYMPEGNLLILTLIGGLLAMLWPLSAVARRGKAKVIEALCAPMGVAYTPAPKDPPMFRPLIALRLLPDAGTKRYEDMFSGRRGDCDFTLCEARFTAGSAKDLGATFLGQVFKLRFSRPFESRVVVLREGWRNRFERPPGLSPVGLEDPVFEKTWEVFGDDQVLARALLTPAFMEQLLALETAYAGKHLRCAFIDGDLVIALEGEDRFEVGGMFANLENRERAERIADDISAVFALIDTVAALEPRAVR